MISLKKLISENVLGDLPSSKLMKMKWNPVTEAHHEEESVEEAAPRMRKDPDVEKLMGMLKDVSRIENGMKSRDSSRYSHVKRDFKKFYDALINLKSTLNVKGPTIPQ